MTTIEALQKRIEQYSTEIAMLQTEELIDEHNIATKLHLANLQYFLQQDQQTLAQLQAENNHQS
jgi:hypothetical protein